MGRIRVIVRPSRPRARIVCVGEAVLVDVDEPPERGKANAALIKLMRKAVGVRPEIVSGHRSREKVLEFPGLSEDEVLKALLKIAGKCAEQGA